MSAPNYNPYGNAASNRVTVNGRLATMVAQARRAGCRLVRYDGDATVYRVSAKTVRPAPSLVSEG